MPKESEKLVSAHAAKITVELLNRSRICAINRNMFAKDWFAEAIREKVEREEKKAK